MAENSKITHPKKAAFLKAVGLTANVVQAAKLVGIDRNTHYAWKRDDAEYARAFAEAWEQGVDVLEAEAVRRAYRGVKEPVFSGGKRAYDIKCDEDGNPILDAEGKEILIPAVVRRYSDTLLMFILNGNRGFKYNRQRLEVSGPNQGPIAADIVIRVVDGPKC